MKTVLRWQAFKPMRCLAENSYFYLEQDRWKSLTAAVRPFIRTVHTVLDSIAEAGHGNTELGAQAGVLIRLTSLGLTLRAWDRWKG